jgi:hypothetical protein
MPKQTNWILTRVRIGWMFLAAGVLLSLVGIFIELEYSFLPYNFRIITGMGILLIGIGVGFLIYYRDALKNELSARRVTAEERDERTLFIRARAGNRAYWVSTALVYLGLMWTSFASNGGLPALSGDVLWFFLAAGVVVPFGIYIVSILVDQRNS